MEEPVVESPVEEPVEEPTVEEPVVEAPVEEPTVEAPAAPATPEAPATPAAPAAPAASGGFAAPAGSAAPAIQEEAPVQESQVNVAAQFSDVAASGWYTNSIQRVVDAGLMNGVADDAFSPDTNMDRAMLATILYRMAGQPVASAASFSDVESAAYYANAVSWAAETGILTEVGTDTFLPTQNITRQLLATALYRYAKCSGYAVDGSGDLAAYTDRDEISSWAYEAMAWANRVGIVNGRGDSRLAPTDTATRAEVATMLVRFMDFIAAQTAG